MAPIFDPSVTDRIVYQGIDIGKVMHAGEQVWPPLPTTRPFEFVAARSADSGAGTELSISVTPPPEAAGCLALLVACVGSGIEPTSASGEGWTQLRNQNNSNANWTRIAWRIVPEDEIGTPVVISLSSARRMAMAVSWYSNAQVVGQADGAWVTGSTASPPFPALNHAISGDVMPVLLGTFRQNLQSGVAPTFGPPAGYSERAEASTHTSSAQSAVAVFDKLTTGNIPVATASAVPSVAYCNTTVLLAPAS